MTPTRKSLEDLAWDEYEAAAHYCARYGCLPEGLLSSAFLLIIEDPEAFERHVRAHRYALAMEGVDQ